MRKGQSIEISNERARLGFNDPSAVHIDDAVNVAPAFASFEPLDQLEQRVFTLVAHDAVEFRKVREQLLVAEARKMSAYREMAIDPSETKVASDAAELRQKGLEYQ